MAELIAQMEHGQFRNERLEQLVLELAERLAEHQGQSLRLSSARNQGTDGSQDELAKGQTGCRRLRPVEPDAGGRCAAPILSKCRSACLFPNRRSLRPCNMVVRRCSAGAGRASQPMRYFCPHRLHNPVPHEVYPRSRRPRTISVHRHIGRYPRDTARCVLQCSFTTWAASSRSSPPQIPSRPACTSTSTPPDAPEKRMAWATRRDDHEEIPQYSQR